MRVSSSEPNTLQPSSSAVYMPLDSMHFSPRGCTSDPPDFGKSRSTGKHSATIQSPRHGFLIVLPEIAKRHSHRACTHHGRQWTQTSRTPAVLELEYVRVRDKTIDGVILSSLLRKAGRESLRESFGAKRHTACMTAMISGPTYGSIMELQRAADTTPSRARRQYTRPVNLFHKRKRKMHTHPE